MTITLNDVRAYLDADEVDYEAASLLGPEALPHLDVLVQGDDPMLAAKATYLASLIPGPEQPAILAAAAVSDLPTVRIAAASGMANLEEPIAEQLIDGLISDGDFGVQRQALIAASSFDSAAMARRVDHAAEEDVPGTGPIAPS